MEVEWCREDWHCWLSEANTEPWDSVSTAADLKEPRPHSWRRIISLAASNQLSATECFNEEVSVLLYHHMILTFSDTHPALVKKCTFLPKKRQRNNKHTILKRKNRAKKRLTVRCVNILSASRLYYKYCCTVTAAMTTIQLLKTHAQLPRPHWLVFRSGATHCAAVHDPLDPPF